MLGEEGRKESSVILPTSASYVNYLQQLWKLLEIERALGLIVREGKGGKLVAFFFVPAGSHPSPSLQIFCNAFMIWANMGATFAFERLSIAFE
jgi:hypothetical protein